MRAKVLCTQLAISGGATVTSAPILLIAGGHFAAYGDSNVPGEDMAFPSSGNAVVSLCFNETTLSTLGGFVLASNSGSGTATGDGAVNIQTSNNYYADSGSGETFTTVASYSPAGGISTRGEVVYLDKVPLGEAMQVQIVSLTTSDAGTVTAYLLSN